MHAQIEEVIAEGLVLDCIGAVFVVAVKKTLKFSLIRRRMRTKKLLLTTCAVSCGSVCTNLIKRAFGFHLGVERESHGIMHEKYSNLLYLGLDSTHGFLS